MSNQSCDVCAKGLVFRWCDTHGVAVCCECGTPYTVYHYDDERKRVEKPPEIALSAKGVELAKRYWTEVRRMVFPGAYDMGILGGRDASYSGATRADLSAWDEWVQRQPDLRDEQREEQDAAS